MQTHFSLHPNSMTSLAPTRIASLSRNPFTTGRQRCARAMRCMGSFSEGTGKVAVVTGGNTGLGKASVEDLAKKGYTVILACRSRERAESAAEEVRKAVEATGQSASLDVIDLDLANLESVQGFVSSFKSKYNKCDVLMNNAGVMALPSRELTKDGFEMQFGVNHLGHYALTAGMMESLLAAPASRVVNVSSVAHTFGTMNFENLKSDGYFGYPALGWTAYGQSKLANVLFTYELHRQLQAAGIRSVATTAVHPGVVDTELPRFLPSFLPLYPLFKLLGNLISPLQGAQGQIALATSDDFDGVSGRYISELSNEGKPGQHEQRRSSPESYDMEAAQRLWQISAELTGSKFNFASEKVVA